jgi:hypothetical protein
MWVVPWYNPPRLGGLADLPPPFRATITRKASRALKGAIITGKAYKFPTRESGIPIICPYLSYISVL